MLRLIRKSDIIADSEVKSFYESLGKPGKRTGRPAKSADGTKRGKLVWVPKPLEEHVKAECDRGVAMALKAMPRYAEGRVHMRVPEDLADHIASEIKMWKDARKARQTKNV